VQLSSSPSHGLIRDLFNYQQQDCHEFLRLLLLGMSEELSGKDRIVVSEDKSIVTDIFCGQMQSTKVCSNCGKESTLLESFWDLSVPLSNG
jgi:ubiquitin C-terminal hydrolase